MLDCNPKYEYPPSVEMGSRHIFLREEFHVMCAAALSQGDGTELHSSPVDFLPKNTGWKGRKKNKFTVKQVANHHVNQVMKVNVNNDESRDVMRMALTFSEPVNSSLTMRKTSEKSHLKNIVQNI